MASNKSIRRLSLYRRLLNNLRDEGVESVYSHQLAAIAGVTAAQVRRDVMEVGYTGTPAKGYSVEGLIQSIRSILDAPEGQGIALIGVGNLGRAILAYFVGRRPNLSIKAAFDADPDKVNRLIHSCRCYPMSELEKVIRENDLHAAIIAVPAKEAQAIVNQLMDAGVKGILNFAPIHLHVPNDVFIEDLDITTSLETVAYNARVILKKG